MLFRLLKTCWLVKQLIAEQTAPGSENKDDIGDHHHKRVRKQLLTKSLLGLLVSVIVRQALRIMFHPFKLFGSMTQSRGLRIGRELLLSILKLIFTLTALLQPCQNIDVICTWTMSNYKTQCKPCKRLAGKVYLLWMWSLWDSQQPTKQQGDPRASLLTSEKAVFCNFCNTRTKDMHTW